MSILLADDTQVMAPAWMGVFALVSLVAVELIKLAGLFDPRPEATLQRQFDPAPVLPLLWNALCAMGAYLFVQTILYVLIAAAEGKPATANPQELLVGGNLVILMIGSQAAALVALILGLAVVIRGGFRKVGLDRSPAYGLRVGLGVIIAVMPLLLLVMNLTELIYRRVGYEHKDAHDLLLAMKPDNLLLRIAGIAAAVVVAPATEELLFRGHLQTLLRRAFSRRERVVSVLPVEMPPGIPAMPTMVPPPLPYQPAAPGVCYLPGFLPSLLAVLLTSVCFALVHPMWSWPPIFVLALALGFAYERTGNLWVSIVMHACFNGLMTAVFLLLSH